VKLPAPGGVHDEEEIEAVVEVLRTSNLEIGAAVAAMEEQVAVLLAKRHGVMVNSGSSALRLAIDLLDLAPGDEIITSPLTFSTDIAPMVQSGIVPVFVDVDPATYQLDAAGIEEAVGPRTRAILVPNLCGNVPDWDAIRRVADVYGLAVVEDSCDVLDSWLGDDRTGTRSDLSVTSFARSHAITAGGNGGMVGVDSPELLDRCLSLRRWGRRSESYLFGSRKGTAERFGPLADGTPYDLVFVFDSLGYNFEPSEIGAAYGLVQLRKLDRFNGRRQANWQRLEDFLATRSGLTTARTTDGARTTWMRSCAIVDEDAPFTREDVQQFLLDRGVETRMVWTGNILRQPGFAGIEHRAPAGGLPACDRIMDRALSLPIHHGLDADHMGFICEQLDALFEAHS
jgi:CDP-4-dehydro-6-deoxyglucose reductase, E1